MLSCPRCKTAISTASKVWSIVDQADKTGKVSEIIVGLYECKTCNYKTITSIGKEKLFVVRMEKWRELNKTLEEANKKLLEVEANRNKLEAEVFELREKLEKELVARAERLDLEVGELRKGKMELEREIDRLAVG